MNEIIEDKKMTVMERAGATRERSWRAVAEALVAEKITVDKFGDEHVEPDHNTRLRAAEMIAKATGDIRADTGGVTNTQINISCSKEEVNNLLTFMQSTKARESAIEQSGEIIDVVKYK